MTSSHVQQPAEQKRCAVLIKQNAGTTYRSYKRDRDKIVIGCLVKVRCLWSIRTTIVLIGLLKVFVNLGNSTWQTDILMVQISKIAFRRDLWYGLTRFKTTTWSLEAIIYIYIFIFFLYKLLSKFTGPRTLSHRKWRTARWAAPHRRVLWLKRCITNELGRCLPETVSIWWLAQVPEQHVPPQDWMLIEYEQQSRILKKHNGRRCQMFEAYFARAVLIERFSVVFLVVVQLLHAPLLWLNWCDLCWLVYSNCSGHWQCAILLDSLISCHLQELCMQCMMHGKTWFICDLCFGLCKQNRLQYQHGH